VTNYTNSTYIKYSYYFSWNYFFYALVANFFTCMIT